MKRTLLKTFMLAALLLVSVASFAVPANPKPITIKQNGRTLTYYLRGDERMHWGVTSDGYTLLNDAQGQMVYAVRDANGNMVASTMLACDPSQRSMNDNLFLANVEKHISYSATQKAGLKKLFEDKHSLTKDDVPLFPATGGVKHLLVVLVNFADKAMTIPKSVFENMCMQDNYNGCGSVHEYFYVNSNGQLDLQIDVVGPVTLDNSMSYYGSDAQSPYGTIHDVNVKEMIKDGIKLIKDSVDLSIYDNDGDGFIDDVAFIYAGTPQSTTGIADEIWPHSGRANGTTSYDGVKVNRYTCSAEKPDQVIGTFVHEFGHALGLPDEYDTDYAESGGSAVTVSSWSVMCEGSYNNNQNSPCLWSNFQKTLVGWIDEENAVIDLTLDQSLDNLRLPLNTGTNDTSYRIFIPETNEFFFLEYRKKQGFDAYIPGDGMLIYHGQMNKINAWVNYGNNSINVNPNDRGWYIEPADGLLNSISLSAAAFPGSKNIVNFLNAKKVNGESVDMKITNVHYLNDSVMMFNFNSNTPVIATNAATNRHATSMQMNGKVLNKHASTNIANKGFYYSTESDVTTAATRVEDEDLTDLENITVSVTGLTNNTTYYYKAFIEDEEGTIYLGEENHAMTTSGFGYAQTKDPTNVDYTSATMNASYTTVGEGTFVEKGFVYVADDKSATPAIGNEGTVKIVIEGEEYGDYSYNLTELEQGTYIKYRAYMTNSYGTLYGNEKDFTTLYPEITNNVISVSQTDICENSVPEQITGTEAQGGFGNFTYLWQQRDNGSSWVDAEGTNNEQNYQPQALSTTTNFRRIAISNNKVQAESNVIIINVNSSKGGTIYMTKSVYNVGDEIKLTLNNYTGDILDWTKGTTEENMASVGNANKAVYTETAEQEGKYYYQVKVQFSQCEPALSEIKEVTVQASSLSDANGNMVLDIMPNPSTNGTFTLNANVSNADIVITNTLGQVVYSENNADLNNKTINLNNAQSGSYIISITAQGKLTTKKLIINK